jgi:hypothetical protein
MPAGALPPAPPPSPSRHRIKQGGLVSGTGRLKHVKRRQQQLQQQHQSPPPPPQPTQPLTPREQFARFYGFTLPPPPPQREDPDKGYPYECEGGFINSPNSIANSASSSSTTSSSSGSSSSPDRWVSGPTHSYSSNDAYTRPSPPPAQFRRSSSHRAASAPTCPSPLDHDELLAKFNDQFIHSRTQSSTTVPETPASPTKRERSILPPGAEGKLIVPDVKLKARCSSTVSLESPPSRRSPSKKSPLSAPSTTQGFERQEVYTSFTLKRPTFECTFYYPLYFLYLANPQFQLDRGHTITS